MSRRNRSRGCSSCGSGTTARSIRARQSTASCGTITVVSDDPGGGGSDPGDGTDPGGGGSDPGDGGDGDVPGGLTREQALAIAGVGGGAALVYLRSRGN